MKKKDKKNFVFTVTTGRSGTMHVAKLLEANIDSVEAHHERIWGFDKFGVETPDISHFHEFNSQGNTTKIMKFWMQKMSRIAKTKKKYYVETSHLLAKAGLVENLGQLKRYGNVKLLFLYRDALDTLISMHKRNTYLNVGDAWMWHLDPDYPKNIVNSKHYKRFELQGLRLWYIHEMRARAEYYKQLLTNSMETSLINVYIKELSMKRGVENLLVSLDYDKGKKEAVVLPPQHKGSEIEIDKGLVEHMKKMMGSLVFDAKKLASDYIKAERRLG